MLNPLLCVHHNGSSYIFSTQQEQIITTYSTAMCLPSVLPAEPAVQFNKGVLLPEGLMPKQTPLEPFGSGEGHRLTPVPRDATKGEVYGRINYQLQRLLKPEELSTSPC